MTSTVPGRETMPDRVRDGGPEPRRRVLSRLRGWSRRANPVDLAVIGFFLAVAAWLTGGLWSDPDLRTLALNPADQTLYEWFLANNTLLARGDIGLVTDRLNAPDGVNLLANTTIIAIGVVLTPVTLLFGAPTTFALVVAGNLAGTAIAWYLLYSRTLGANRAAAGVGAALCGFGPGILSQSNSHLHMTAQWLVPAIVWCVVRLLRAAEPGTGADERRPRLLTAALALAGLVTLQTFIGEEVLFLAAVTLALMTLGYAAARPRYAIGVLPRFAAGLGITAVAAGAVLAYPLWAQFAGPQGVPNGPFSPGYFSADLASWPAVSPLSLAGSEEAAQLTTGPAEYNTFLGWLLLIVAVGCLIWLWRNPLAVACGVAGVGMAALSLGPKIKIDGEYTEISAPYALLTGVPVVDGALPMRFALALLPLIGTVLVLAMDRALRSDSPAVRVLVPTFVVVALLPIAPTPLPTTTRPPVPQFISGGQWRDCVRPGGVLVPVPLPTPDQPWPMRWATAANAGFGTPEGFFIGPYSEGGRASMGTSKRPTSALLSDAAKNGQAPQVTDEQRAQARTDIDFWGASCVVLAADEPQVDTLRDTLEQLLGPGSQVADAWVWRVAG